MSIRLRLTLLFSIILALTLAAFSALLYVNVSRSNQDFVEDALVEEGDRLVDNREFRIGSIVLPASKFAGPETYIQTLSFDGEIADKSPNLGEVNLPLSPEGLAALQSGQPWTETTEVEGERLLVYSKPVLAGDRIAGAVQVARSLAEQDRALSTLRTILVVAGSAVLALAFLGGWVLAGAALRPIKKLSQEAAAIGAEQDFAKRVSYKGPKDELGGLAATLNSMLGDLQASYQQVQQALYAQRRFVADASHELRTPLTTIRGNLALLDRDPPIPLDDRTAVLTDIISECERLIRLVNELLALARTDAGQPIYNETVAVKPIVEDVCRQARLLSPDKKIEVSSADDIYVNGDSDALRQVLLILLDNALKHTHENSRIGVNCVAGDGRVRIDVTDDGPGIAPDVLPHIFDRFYRADDARAGNGTGLGLAIAKALVEAQSGTITASSEPGQGATFTVDLPRTQGSPLTRSPEPAARS